MWTRFLAWLKSLFAIEPAPLPPAPAPSPATDGYGNVIIEGEFGTGYKPDPFDPEDKPFSEYEKIAPLEYMPKQVDHSQFHGPVVNQGRTGSCVGQSVRAACEYLARAFWGMPDLRLSSLYPYRNARELEGGAMVDNGTYIRLGVKGVDKNGICTMDLWPFDASKVNDKPPQAAYTDGAQREIRDYLRCENKDECRAGLAQSYPVLVGIDCFSTISNQKARLTGVVDVPGPNEPRNGGHAICLVGYDDYKQQFKFKNSWGDWGDKGYGYLPYAYFDRGLVHDMWCIRPKIEVDPTGNK